MLFLAGIPVYAFPVMPFLAGVSRVYIPGDAISGWHFPVCIPGDAMQ
jgi:hypothetical protein